MAGVSLPELSHPSVMTEEPRFPEVSVVVPLFNEEESISLLQTELSAALKNFDYEIVFVDDGSGDCTADRIERKMNVRLIRFEKNAVRRRFTKEGVRDTGCTLKAMRHECVSALVPFKGMHRFIPALVKGAGFGLVEIPVNHRLRRFGRSKYGLGNRALRATIDMFGVRWLLSRRLNYKIRES